MPTTKFTRDQFQPSSHKTAAQKAILANLFVKFIESDFDEEIWLKNPSLYNWLMNAFMFIAHYDIHGFYVERFSCLDVVIETLQQIRDDQYIRHDDAGRNGDLNRAIQDYVKENDLVTVYQERLALAQKDSSLRQLKELVQQFPAEAAALVAESHE